jgi:hypothetical protein
MLKQFLKAIGFTLIAFLAAFAVLAVAKPADGEVGRWEKGGNVIVLTTVKDDCPAQMTRFFAVLLTRPFMGCWMIVGSNVLMLGDGEDEPVLAPVEAFKSKPL